MKVICLSGMCLVVAVNTTVFAQERGWPWSDGSAVAASQENVLQVPVEDESFVDDDEWTVADTEDDLRLIEEGMNGATPDQPGPGGPPAVQAGDDTDFEKLVKENVKFRSEIETLSTRIEDAHSDKRRLEDELRGLEDQLAALVSLFKGLEQPAVGNESEDPEAMKALEENRADRESAIEQLQAEKKALRQEYDQLKLQLAKQDVTSQSDIREMEAFSEARDKATQELKQATRKITILLDEAKAARLAEQTHKQKMKGVAEKVPTLEREVAGLRDALAENNTRLENRQTELATHRAELERREYRLRKAARISRLIEETREEVSRSDLEERRDLHLSLADVYAESGQSEKARQQYLLALSVDPSAASSHYKLAILYDDVFKDKRKAAMHYRAYLKLSPDAQDVDTVKRWLTSRDMN